MTCPGFLDLFQLL